MNKIELDQIFIMTFRGYEVAPIIGVEGDKVIIQGKYPNEFIKEDLHFFYKLTLTPLTLKEIKEKIKK